MSQDDRPATRASQVSFSSAGRPLSNQSNAPPLHDFGHFQDITAQARGETRAGPSNEQPATETVLGKHRREPSGWSTGASTVASTRAIPPSSKKQRTWPSGASEIFPADLTTLSPDQLIDNYLIATKNNLEKAADSFEAYRDFVLIADDTSHTKSEPLAKLLRDTEVRFKTFASSQQLAGAKMNSRFADQALEKLAPFDRNARTCKASLGILCAPYSQLKLLTRICSVYGDLYNFMWANGGYQAGMTKDSLATQYFEVTLEDYVSGIR